MLNYRRLLLLAGCGSVGICAAIAVVMQPGPATPNTQASTDKSSATNKVSLRKTHAQSTDTEQEPEPTAPRALAASYPRFAPLSQPAPPTADTQATQQLTKQVEIMQRSLDGIRETNQQQRHSLELALSHLENKIQQGRELPTPVALVQPLAEPPSPDTTELPPPAKITRDAVDDKLTIVLQDSDLRDALKLLGEQSGLNILASEKVTGKLTASLTDIDAASALAAILKTTGFVARYEDGIVYVATPEELETMDQSQDRVVTRVYRPNYVKAADLEKLFTPLLTPTIGKVTVSTPAEVDIQSDQVKTGGDSFADSDVVIVRDYAQIINQIDELFTEVDIMPRQVSIEAMIVNVRLNDENRMGVSFEALRDKGTIRIQSELPTGTLPSTPTTTPGLKIGFLDSSANALVTALETIGDTNVVASPRLTCLNKMRAEIQIGEQLGYVNTTVTQTFSTQSVSFLDVGTLLRLRPFIGNDGTIRMEVHPELSTGSVSVSGSLTLPNKSVTQVTTNVLCNDGCTAVIGGLIREDLQTTTSQVPFLGSTPWIGPLFRQKTEKVGRAEIIILITPRIINNDTLTQEGVKYGNEFSQRQENYFDKMNPLAKRSLGLAQLRRARAAYAVGDFNTALRQVNLAIHYDPLNREASTLRQEVLAAGGLGNESVPAHLRQGVAPFARTHNTDYTKQGAPWKTEPPFSTTPSFVISDDEGPDQPQPTKIRTIEYTPPKLRPVGKP